jgi:hypothetical protein
VFNALVHHAGNPPLAVFLRDASSGQYTIHDNSSIIDTTSLESEFAVFMSIAYVKYDLALFHLRVTEVGSTACVAVLRDELAEGEHVPKLPQGAVAVQIKTGQAIGNLRVRVAGNSVYGNLALDAAERTRAVKGAQRWGVSICADGPAELGIVSGDGECTLAFEILDEQICSLGLTGLTVTVPAQLDHLEVVLRAAAHFFYHLRRTPTINHLLQSKVAMHVHSLKETSEIFQPDQHDVIPPVMNAEEPPVWRVMASNSEKHYGVELKSRVNFGFSASLLYFDCGTFEIS